MTNQYVGILTIDEVKNDIAAFYATTLANDPSLFFESGGVQNFVPKLSEMTPRELAELHAELDLGEKNYSFNDLVLIQIDDEHFIQTWVKPNPRNDETSEQV